MNNKKLWSVLVVAAVATVIAITTLFPVKQILFDPTSSLPDGSIYRGEFNNGKFHGEGILKWSNGDEYTGGFRNGMMHGTGTLIWENGEKYTGEFRNGMMHGTGKLFLSGGDVYQGEFNKGDMSGKGRYTADDGSTYEGEFAFGKFHGVGDYHMSNGDSYSGEFVKGLMQGKGTYRAKSGRVYTGDFVNDEFTGNGTLISGKKNRYSGEFKDWEFDGDGEVTTESGDIYKGTFEQGQLVGTGVHISQNGDKYTGEFMNWSYNGKGELTKKSGEKYIGQFQYGQMHGQGKLITIAEDGKELTKSGEWEYGSFVDDKKQERMQMEARAEHALYTQEQALAKAFGELKPGEKGKIDLFFLGVAGYGGQEVFRKEVAYIHNLFEQQYGIDGRSIQLINSRDGSLEYPLATVTSFKRAIKEIESKMNPDEDILFLYMTSHGSEKRGFSLSFDGISLPDIGAQQLADILDDSAIKFRVVMVSACYSGGFVAPVENKNTLIITAAAKDRKSFGCSDENDITDFAKAYFVESLPTAVTFEDAFIKARNIIEKEEDSRHIKQHSSPQLAMGAAMREQLAKWRKQFAGSQANSGMH